MQVYEIKSTLSVVDERLSQTKTRVDKITDVLPDLRIKLAMHEIERLFQTALIVTKPIKTSSGEYKTLVHFLDSNNRKRTTYVFKLAEPQNKDLTYLIKGIAHDAGPNATSLRELVTFSEEIEKPVNLPQYIDDNSSFIFRNANNTQEMALKNLPASVIKNKIINPIYFWRVLATELENNADSYKE